MIPLLAPLLALAFQEGAAIPVRIEANDPAPYFVGQAIGLTVRATARGVRPEIVAPRIANAELVDAGRGVRPVSVTGIGDLAIDETNEFAGRYRLTPTRAGTLIVPPFAAKLPDEGRVGRSAPVSLNVRDLPAAGRTRAFLGGVGRLDGLDASADPHHLAVGDSFTFRIRLEGPAARGSTVVPDLAAFDRLPLGLSVRPLPPEFVDDPPSRTFAYRIRATAAGEAELPGVAVAWFDPKSRSYQTKTTPRVPIRVARIEAFDPSTIVATGPPASASSSATRFVIAAALMFGLVAAGAGVVMAARWLAARRRRDARRFARRLARSGLADAVEPSGLARAVTAGLVDYLALASGRPAGAITPDEARDAVGRATGEPALADRAAGLVASCDLARFSGRKADAEALRADALALFRDLSQSRDVAGAVN